MRKDIILFLLLFFFFCSEAPKVSSPSYERVVLCEFFTHIRCSYCPYAARTLDSLEKEFNDSIAIIAYHRRRLGDTLSPAYCENRAHFYYQDDIEPTIFFDGEGPVRTEDPSLNYSVFKGMIERKRGIKPKLQLYLTESLFTNTLKLRTTIVKFDTLRFDSLHLFFLLTEDSVRCLLPGGSDSIFNKVVRVMWPDEDGIPLEINQDTIRNEFTLPWRPEWQKERFQVVVFIQDEVNKEVLVCVKRRLL
jgi:thiol-disulfide isomerase/thioredoxin